MAIYKHFRGWRNSNCKTVLNFLLIAALLLSSCSVSKTISNPKDDYQNAIRDASVAEPHEIYRNLTAITPNNPDLIWRGKPGASGLLVVTWSNFEGYKSDIGEYVENPIFCWVTIAPQLQNFCIEHKNSQIDMALRLKQLLGLPPESEKSLFVEMWVSPEDLFRPSPDPEITDHESELNFPESRHFIKVSKEHIHWFNDMKKASYSESGYPWTRLGYSYDWGNPESEIGLSEFVIRKGATVLIKSVSTIDEYCKLY